MAITSLPTKTDASLGRAKTDASPAANLDTDYPAAEHERIKDTLIDVVTEVGLSDGSTASSLNKRVGAIEAKTPKYPAIDANTILAWDFTGTSGSIANRGSHGSGADMVTIGAKVRRNVPGPVSAGVGYNGGVASTTRIYTATGAGASLGSGSFTSSITVATFFALYSDPGTGGIRRLIVKAYQNSWAGAPYGLSIEINGGTLTGYLQSAAGFRSVAGTLGAADLFGYGQGLHMAALTYGTEGAASVSRLYYDGVEVASAAHASQSNVVLGAATEGPWNIGSIFTGGSLAESIVGVTYHSRAENAVRDAAWIHQAWRNANGWP